MSTDIGLILGLTIPFVAMGLIPVVCVTVACYYQRKRRLRRVVVRRVAGVPARHEVIVVTCRNVASGTSNRFVDGSAMGGGVLSDAPPAYRPTPDPAELVRHRDS